MTITEEKINRLQTLIRSAEHIVISAHKSPDGDSIGSSLGLYHYLNKKHPNVFVCHPDTAPNFLHWMPGYENILNYEEHAETVVDHFQTADLIFCLDYNSLGRIGQMEKLMSKTLCPKVMIDHHPEPDMNFCDLVFSDVKSCSTAQLIFEIIQESNDIDLLDSTVGTPLYAGIVTDTGSFRFSSTLPKTHRIVADLMERGVKHSNVHEAIFDTNTLDRIRLVSFILLEKLVVIPEYETAYLSLSIPEQEKFSAAKGNTEGLVNQALGIQGVKIGVFFNEVDGLVKISFRSKGSIPINEMAKLYFQGGGHLNAAGGKFVGNLEGAVQKFVTILPNFVQENKVHF